MSSCRAAAAPQLLAPALRRYGDGAPRCQPFRRLVVALGGFAVAVLTLTGAAAARPIALVAFGDSLSAGYQLPADAAFPAVLEKSLRAKGYDVTVTNAGVSGDTAQAGLDRLDWSVPEGTDAVILELGANDMLRGLDTTATQKTLDTILTRLQARHIKVLLAGMLAPENLGPEYRTAFDAIYPALAKAHGVPLYPFFLDGVAQDPSQKLADGMHPNARGVDTMVKTILPATEALVRSVPKS